MTTMITSPIDEETYTLLQEIMADEFTELVECFLTDAQQGIATLQQCLATQDSEQVGTICHKLKSSSKLIGAFGMAELTHLLEAYKEDHNQPLAATHLQNLIHEFAQVQDWLGQQQQG